MRNGRRAGEENRLRVHPRFASQFLSTRRDLVVYLPPGYDQSRDRYPVLYLQDGQNLFSSETAFYGQEWRVDAIADQLICSGAIRPLIVVGVWHAGVRRVSEYTPTRDPRTRKGGKALRYAQMLAREIKPFVDHEYRTRKPAAHAAVGGSSLGALVSLSTGLAYPRVFGSVVAMSPSVWWDRRSILQAVESFRERTRPRIWVDVGTAEGDSADQVVDGARALGDALVRRGWDPERDLLYREYAGADHSEGAWSARLPDVLRALFPP
jgi:predicted alpha/beta superfamily hydrolase